MWASLGLSGTIVGAGGEQELRLRSCALNTRGHLGLQRWHVVINDAGVWASLTILLFPGNGLWEWLPILGPDPSCPRRLSVSLATAEHSHSPQATCLLPSDTCGSWAGLSGPPAPGVSHTLGSTLLLPTLWEECLFEVAGTRGFSCGLGLTHPMSPLSAGPSAAVGWGLSVPVLRSLLLSWP